MRYLHAPALTAARPIALFIALLGALLSPSAADTGDGRTIKNYVHVSWTLADGAPPDIWALVQAPDGYMWLGTGAGLYRFDGIRFERVRPMAGDAFPSTDILSLFAAPTGEIWIGYQNGGISVLKSGRLTNFSQGHLSQSVNEIVLGADNAIWVATDSGLARHADGRWQDIDGDWGMPAGVVQTLRVGHDGTLWAVVRHSIAADSGSELKFLRPGSRRFETSTDPQSTSWFGTTFVTQVQEDAGGRFWASGQDTSVAVLPTSQVRARPAPALQSPGAPLPIRSKYILLDRDGNVWGRHPLGGIFRDRIQIQDPGMLTLGAGHFADRFSSKDGLTSDIDRSFLEDREGNVWVGTNLGLDLFRPANIVAQAGIPVTAPFGYRVAAGDDGTVYIEDSQTLFRIRSGGAAQVVYRSPSRIGFLHVTGDGSVWLAVKGKLLRLTKTGMTSIALPADIRSELLQTCAIDRSGVLWVSVWDKGIFRLDKTVWTRFTVAPELAHIGPLMMQFDAQGRLWLHYLHRPLVLVDGNEVRNFSEKDGPDIGEIETIYAGARDVLFAGDQGLARFDGHRFQTLHSTDLPVLNRVAGIVETARGETWLNTIAGILRIQTKDLNRAFDHPEYRLRYQTLDFRDGLPGLAQEDSYEPTAIEATDGRLWFITNHGIAWIDPAHLVRNPLPPPVAIRSLTVDGTEYPFPKTLELAEGVSNLRIDYEALSLSIPSACVSAIGWTAWTKAGSTPATAARPSIPSLPRAIIASRSSRRTMTACGTPPARRCASTSRRASSSPAGSSCSAPLRAWPCSGCCIRCGCGRSRRASATAWRSACGNASGSRASCTTRCSRVSRAWFCASSRSRTASRRASRRAN